MARYVLALSEIDETHGAVVGSKAVHLGALSRIDGIRVPSGYCVTTEAFRRVIAETPTLDERLESLASLKPDDRDAIDEVSAEIRRTIEGIAVPAELTEALTRPLAELGEHIAYAVRSSATAEDLPTASFAGQQDTYLNIAGKAAILEHVRRCWASLFTARAVAYRLRNGVDHRKVDMAVVVQQMVFPRAAGVLFTADPVTGNRKVASVEAVFGLGEALVAGLVNADAYRVRDETIVSRAVATKHHAIQGSPAGGTVVRDVDPERQLEPALTDAEVVRLVQLGRRIEAHFGCPQDIEWCLVGDDFHIVQSRPITTLFPIPSVGDQEKRVYVSVGHQQMMTDAMKPLGLSMWKLTTRAPMHEAGGRLFVDVTRGLASRASRAGLLAALGKSDPLIRDALETVLERGDFIPSLPEERPAGAPAGGAPAGQEPPPIETNPALVAELIELREASLGALKRDIQTKSGSALFDFILADLVELQRILFDPRSHQVVMAGIEATWWLNEHLWTWLGERQAADALTQSVPNNVTSEMGLALLDVADAIRPHEDVVVYLEQAQDDGFLDELPRREGGREARDAIQVFLERYGMRCVGEIDITRPRFGERPSTLLPLILRNIRSFGPGAGKQRFEQGLKDAQEKEQELLRRLRALPEGEKKADETKRMIERVRTFIGYREYPKYSMVSRYFEYKRALLQEAERLVQAGVLRDSDEVFDLTFQEFHDVVRTRRVDHELIRQRREIFKAHRALTPPRVLTSDGEAIAGAYRRDDVPAGALVGLPVSAGIVEGRARVMLNIADADLEPGDILVTPFTDPSWTPLFVGIQGLVTEVGGLMTHGAVIAREYGLAAVVGVERATQRIRDGQRIRVHGTAGYVELL